MKRILMAAVLAASTLGMAGAAMAADNGNTQNLDQDRATATTRWSGSSDDSFIKQQNLQYNQDRGE